MSVINIWSRSGGARIDTTEQTSERIDIPAPLVHTKTAARRLKPRRSLPDIDRPSVIGYVAQGLCWLIALVALLAMWFSPVIFDSLRGN
jgi:hypothetical protein